MTLTFVLCGNKVSAKQQYKIPIQNVEFWSGDWRCVQELARAIEYEQHYKIGCTPKRDS